MSTRGARTDEAIDIIKAVCAGGGPQWVEHHGRHYDFDRLMIAPAPGESVKILVGGHSDPAMKRAARVGDGWVSANVNEADLAEMIPRLHRHLADAGRTPDGFEVNALAMDVFDPVGFRRLEDLGVTECQVVPWYFYGGDPTELDVQVDSLARFADTVIASMS